MTYFDTKTYAFLRALKKNNNREWFTEHKGDFEESVQEPMLSFIRDFEPKLEKVSPHMLAIARKQGGSLFRIYKDTRFSSDKSPYKTHAAAHFRHEANNDVHAPGYYFHIEPGNNIMGAGIWKPDATALRAIRTKIAEDSAGWKKVLNLKIVKSGEVSFEGESLSRVPKGFEKDHPMANELKRKDFILVNDSLKDADICSDDLMKVYTKFCRDTKPLMQFLCDAMGLAF